MAPPAAKHQERFPNYNDGDVKIIIGSRQYTLHANVLENNSPVLRDLIHSVGPAPLTTKAIKHGATILFRFSLTENKYEQPAVDYILQPVQLDNTGQPKHSNRTGDSHTFEYGKVVPGILAAYDAVLGAFYNMPISIGDSQDDPLKDLLRVALDITIVAEYLQCIHIITNPIEACLQATGQNLFKAISSNPTAWLDFSNRVRSKVIFREALIHAAGQYNTPGLQRAICNGNLADEVVQVLQRKGRALIDNVTMAERHFTSYYPTVLMREKTVGRVDRDNIGRANYGNDIIMWIALCVFRHWCADHMAADMTHHAPDIGYQFIKAVQEGGNAYLSRTLMQTQFHQRFPMSPKGMACVEHRLSEIKENVKQWAIPLMHNAAHLDVKRFPVKYFTCTDVANQDYPWKFADRQDADCEYEDETMSDTCFAPPAPSARSTGNVYNAMLPESGGVDDDDLDQGYPEMTEEEFDLQEEGQEIFRALQEARSAETRSFQNSTEYGDDTEVDTDEHRYDLALKNAKGLKELRKVERRKRITSRKPNEPA